MGPASHFAEYRDDVLLARLGITLPKVPLPKFWDRS
jgi:hypothetical protein